LLQIQARDCENDTTRRWIWRINLILKTAGFMWNRNYVDWSKRKLLGVSENGGDDQENFADQSAIYGLYYVSQTCVYIGQAGKGETSCLFERLRAHALDDHLFCFWERFTWFGLYSAEQLKQNDWFDPLVSSLSAADALNNLESIATYLALPRFNRRFGSGFEYVKWYYQKEEYDAERKRSRSN
jgi:hypothetical protein